MGKRLYLATTLLLASNAAVANIAFTGYVGHTSSQEVNTEKETKVDIKDDVNYAISIDNHDGISKYGIYYSTMSSTPRGASHQELDLEYLLFQSAAIMPVDDKISTYLGAHLGINRISPTFSDADSFFATGLFGGVEYKITENIIALGEARWLATTLKNESSTICTNSNDGSDCDWYFKGDILNQFQFNVGITYRF